MQGEKQVIICYTRTAKEDADYSRKLADSMHLALVAEDGGCIPLNHNCGILYAKAVQNPDATLQAKSLKNPWVFQMADGSFGVIAQRIEPDGSEDVLARGKLLFFTSGDLVLYQEQPLLDLGTGSTVEEAVCRYNKDAGSYSLQWRDKQGDCFEATLETLTQRISGRAEEEDVFMRSKTDWGGVEPAELPEGAIYRNRLPVSQETADYLRCRLLVPVNIANDVPAAVKVSTREELCAVRALARYSDGSQVEKKVDWYCEGVDFTRPGTCHVTGRVHQERYEFPMAWHRADPCIGKWNGRYYFIATNDFDGNHSLSIREADTVAGLVTAQETVILNTNMYPHLGNLLWAPEFHVIRDRLYIFHAGTPGAFEQEQCHVMALKTDGNPAKAADWERPVRVVKKDGSPLYGEQGITLDMTEFEADGRCYAVWSQRQFFPVDQGAWLYMAELDPDQPWKLLTDPVLLSMPEFGWANNHIFVDEGPFALIKDGKIFLTFSSAAVDSTYVVGLLSADIGADLLNPDSWIKENYPLMSSRSKEGEFGTGHNSYIMDEDGMIWNAYHGRPGIEGPRSSGLRRVHFNHAGFPVLDLTEELDLVPELAWVGTDVTVTRQFK